MLDKRLIGKEYPPFSFEVEKGKIREFARAIGDMNPVYHDEEAAKREGFESLVAPPTFGTVCYAASGLMYTILEDLKVNLIKLLQGGQEYEYFSPIQAGTVLTSTTKITDIFEKSGKAGTMHFFVIGTSYVDQNSRKLLTERLTFIVRD